MKRFLTFLLVIVANCGFSQKLEWIPFNWVGDSVSGKYYNHLAMTIPVTIENLPHKFNMQLDLGAVRTNFYGNSIQPYLDEYDNLESKIDTTLTFMIQGQTNYMFKGVSLRLGDISFGKRNIGYFKNFGDVIIKDSIKSSTEQHIGTIAPDLFQNKILIIDFPNQKICVTEKVPDQFVSASFKNFKIRDGRIKIPLTIDGKDEDFLYDTGSSIFALITTKENASKISSKKVKDSVEVSSWGEKMIFYGKKINSKIKFGKIKLSRANVYYDSNEKDSDFYSEEKIWGITGNLYFLNRIVIIDYKNQLFGLK